MNILIFAGTTEGRELAESLAAMGERPTVSVATEYGRVMLNRLPKSVRILAGRQDAGDMALLLTANRFDLVVDATHPYAVCASDNIRRAATVAGVEYLRLVRQASAWDGCLRVETTADAVHYLSKTAGNILLATGAKELAAFAEIPDFTARAYVRVLPMRESLDACARLHLPASHIVAMQGPFSKELNVALIRHYSIAIMATRDGGREGGFAEKAGAAEEAGIHLLLIGRPAEKEGMDFAGVVQHIREKMEEGG